MIRFEEGTIIIGKGIELTEEEILRLEDELIQIGRLEETDYLEYNLLRELIVKYEPILDLMDQQSQVQSHNPIPPQNSSGASTIFGSTRHSIGQPSREAYTDYGSERDDIKPRGKRFPLETIDKKLLLDDGRFLNLTAHDPQSWPTVLEMWSQIVARKYDELEIEKTPVEMYSYLEKFLGETARAAWEAYKKNFPADFARDIELGANPYNFTNKIQILLLGTQPNTSVGTHQVDAIRKLEQIQIKKWIFIKPFLQDFMYYSTIAGCFYDQTIGEKLFMKLPEPLGSLIHKKYKEQTVIPQLDNIATRIKFIIEQLVEKCTEMQIVKQLKGEYSFCRNIYTPQRYDKNEKKIKPQVRRPFKRRFYLKRSTSRKPYLNKDHHVRKFDKNRDYKNKLSCFTCGSTDHLVRDCTKRKNYHNKESVLIDCVNEDLLHIDEYVSDTESIYSIVSYIDPNEFEDTISDIENDEFVDNILESSRKYRDKQVDDINKLDQIETMLFQLG